MRSVASTHTIVNNERRCDTNRKGRQDSARTDNPDECKVLQFDFAFSRHQVNAAADLDDYHEQAHDEVKCLVPGIESNHERHAAELML